MKNIVITGGGSGVVFAIARDLAVDNKVILVGRNENKLQSAKNSLGDNASYVAGDLSTVSGREKVVDYILKNTNHIDVLIHSAGVYPTNSQDNISNNLLVHYYLTLNLLKALKDSRVLIVAGNPQAIMMAPICERQFNAVTRAVWTVTHKTLLVQLLINKLRDNQTTINSFFPGNATSDLMPYTKSLVNTLVPVGKLLAFDKRFEHISGQFFDDRGNAVALNSEKYNQANAMKVLSQYIPEM